MEEIKLWKEAREEISNGNFIKALELLNSALNINSNNTDIISERAVVFFHMGDKKKSLSELDRCLEMDSGNPYRYSSRAYIKSTMGMLDEAIDDYEICVTMDPNDPIAYNNLALLLERKGRLEMSKRYFKKAEELEGIDRSKRCKIEDVESQEISEDKSRLKVEETNNDSELKYQNEEKWTVLKDVVTKKSVFKEYISFVANGFKIKKKAD